MAEENKRRPTKEVTEEERLALAQNILKSVGLEEFPKGSAESFERLYDTLDISRDDDLGKNPSRVSDAERKELEQLESKSRLNPTKFKDEFLSKRDNIIKRDSWYKNYDAARNKVIDDIAPYVSSLGALPSSSFYQSNVRRANRADTAEKINDILKRARESVFSKNRERRDWFDSFTAKPTLAVASPDSVPAYTPTMGETKPSGFSKIESSVPSSFSPVSIGGSIDKRKLLAEELRRFAAGESQETAQSLKEQGGEIGVSPTQLSALYQKYKSEEGAGSTFAQQEEQARARSEAAGAFGGEGQRGESLASSVKTPNLDRLAQMQNEPIGSRPMGSERRIITSPEGQMRLMARKAARAGIDVGQLISSNKGDVMAAFGELEAAGLGAKGIRTQEEVRSQPALQAQAREARASLLKEQAEAVRKAEAERIAKEKEEADRKEKERLAKEEEERKEKERLAAAGEGDITALRDEEERSPRRSTINPNSRPTNPNRV